MNKYVIIVAGGMGRRMKTDKPKQFLRIGKKPMIIYSIETFFLYDRDIKCVVVLPSVDMDLWKKTVEKGLANRKIYIVTGGEERFHSVKNGLTRIENDEGLVAIHDAVRPLVSLGTIERCFDMAAIGGNAIPVMEVRESLRMVNNDNSIPIERSKVKIIQTPQVFRVGLLKAAYNQAYTPVFTDDASVFEKAGHTIHLVEGNRENIKITTPEDFIIAKSFIQMQKQKRKENK